MKVLIFLFQISFCFYIEKEVGEKLQKMDSYSYFLEDSDSLLDSFLIGYKYSLNSLKMVKKFPTILIDFKEKMPM
jgi:hypothetical protein